MDQISLLRAIGLLSALGEPDDDEKIDESSVLCESARPELTNAYEGKSTASLLAPISKFWPRSKFESPRSEGRHLIAKQFSFDEEKSCEPKSKRIYLPSLDSDHEAVVGITVPLKSNLLEVIPLNSFSSSTLATSTKSSSFSTLVTRNTTIEVLPSMQSSLNNSMRYLTSITAESPNKANSKAGADSIMNTVELPVENSDQNLVEDTGTSTVFDLANTLKMLELLGEVEADDCSGESSDCENTGGREDDRDRSTADILEGQNRVPVKQAECNDKDNESLGSTATSIRTQCGKIANSRSPDIRQAHVLPAMSSEHNPPSADMLSSDHSEFNRRVKKLLEAIIASDNSDAEDDCSYGNSEREAISKNHLDSSTVDNEISSTVGGNDVLGEKRAVKRRADRAGEVREDKCNISTLSVEDRATYMMDEIEDADGRSGSHDMSDTIDETKYESVNCSSDTGGKKCSTASPVSSSESISISKSFSDNCFRCGGVMRSTVVSDVRRNSDSICFSDRRDSMLHCKCFENDAHKSCGIVLANGKTRSECIEAESRSVRSAHSAGVCPGVRMQDACTLSASHSDLITSSSSRDSNGTSVGSPQSVSVPFN